MAIRKSTGRKSGTTSQDKLDKSLDAALENLEQLVRERILTARDPLKTGLKLAGRIRQLAGRVDDEVRAEGIALTEAGYTSDDAVGVGIGVF